MALKTPNPSGGQLASTQSPVQFWITLEAGEPAEARIVATALAPAGDQRLLYRTDSEISQGPGCAKPKSIRVFSSSRPRIAESTRSIARAAQTSRAARNQGSQINQGSDRENRNPVFFFSSCLGQVGSVPCWCRKDQGRRRGLGPAASSSKTERRTGGFNPRMRCRYDS